MIPSYTVSVNKIFCFFIFILHHLNTMIFLNGINKHIIAVFTLILRCLPVFQFDFMYKYFFTGNVI